MPVIGSVTSTAVSGETGTVFKATEIREAVKAAVGEVHAAGSNDAAINARFTELEGTLDQLVKAVTAIAQRPVVAEPLSTETVQELTPAQKAAATRAANKAAEEDAKAGE